MSEIDLIKRARAIAARMVEICDASRDGVGFNACAEICAEEITNDLRSVHNAAIESAAKVVDDYTGGDVIAQSIRKLSVTI
jgi:hypothetical protein